MKFFRNSISLLFISSSLLGFWFSSCKDSDSSAATLNAVIYLDDCDSSLITHYAEILKQHPLVRDVAFISKEIAKKRYLADGNDDWSEVLKENPLPDSFELRISKDGFSDEEIPLFKKFVGDAIPCVNSINIPQINH